ncbi:hypothetical protein [Azospirillum brasilense]|uniref:hypothetical protein n=1 Tax=Azospirillum brasilense TaxID=192 RepID=UPI0011EBB1CE|nr:hypothetical protein [Azospirillum brasilense]
MMTVTVVGALPDGSTLSAVPLTVDGTAQPETMIVADDPLTVTYQPADCQAPVMVELSLSGLDLRLRHNGCATVVVERNADLMPNAGWTVSSDFILTTTPATFPQPVTPLVDGPGKGYDIATVVAEPESPTLANWLSALLSEVVGTAAQPRISATLGFRFAQYSGTDSAGTARTVYAVQPVTVSRTVVLGDDDGADVSLDGCATALADAFTAWANAKTVPTATGEFLITLCLFSVGRTAGTALLQLPNRHLALGEVTV